MLISYSADKYQKFVYFLTPGGKQGVITFTT